MIVGRRDEDNGTACSERFKGGKTVVCYHNIPFAEPIPQVLQIGIHIEIHLLLGIFFFVGLNDGNLSTELSKDMSKRKSHLSGIFTAAGNQHLGIFRRKKIFSVLLVFFESVVRLPLLRQRNKVDFGKIRPKRFNQFRMSDSPLGTITGAV